ncbi:hypothetical protein niasHS_016141 [Heterodera schachtii]|uniref:Uncharacterized protein n=1 Tax=Heterodera schachtii TaxID=97005 RepID=A0ABD2HS60_HETSC
MLPVDLLEEEQRNRQLRRLSATKNLPSIFLDHYSSVFRKQLEDYVLDKMRKLAYEELDVKVLFDQILDHVLRIDRAAVRHSNVDEVERAKKEKPPLNKILIKFITRRWNSTFRMLV